MTTKSKYPECEKLDETANVYATLHEFNEWLSSNGYEIVHFEKRGAINYGKLIYEFMNVDEKKLQKEWREMLGQYTK